jgi:hypothetical protein
VRLVLIRSITVSVLLSAYWASYMLLMIRNYPVYDASGRIAFYSAAKYAIFRREEIGRFVESSWLNHFYLPADYIYYNRNKDSFLVRRSRDPKFAAEFIRFY